MNVMNFLGFAKQKIHELMHEDTSSTKQTESSKSEKVKAVVAPKKSPLDKAIETLSAESQKTLKTLLLTKGDSDHLLKDRIKDLAANPKDHIEIIKQRFFGSNLNETLLLPKQRDGKNITDFALALNELATIIKHKDLSPKVEKQLRELHNSLKTVYNHLKNWNDLRKGYEKDYKSLTLPLEKLKTFIENLKKSTKTSTDAEQIGLNKRTQDGINLIKNNFFGINLDSVLFMPESIQGLPKGASLSSFISELEAYVVDDLSPGEKNEINEAIALLKQSYLIELDMGLLSAETVKNEKFYEKYPEAFTHLIKDVETKIVDIPIGEKFLLPGGTKDHLMLYELIRTEDENNKACFTLKIFNSGAGSQHHPTGFLSFLNPFAKVQTYVIEHVSIDLLINSEPDKLSFIGQLIEKNVKSDSQPSSIPLIGAIIDLFSSNSPEAKISTIYKIIKAEIIDKGGKVVKNSTRKHGTQEAGSCARKAYNFLLREEFFKSDLSYQKFKVKATQLSIDRLKVVRDSEDSPVKKTSHRVVEAVKRFFRTSLIARIGYSLKNSISTQTMLDLGEDILARRERKLEKLKKKAKTV